MTIRNKYEICWRDLDIVPSYCENMQNLAKLCSKVTINDIDISALIYCYVTTGTTLQKTYDSIQAFPILNYHIQPDEFLTYTKLIDTVGTKHRTGSIVQFHFDMEDLKIFSFKIAV